MKHILVAMVVLVVALVSAHSCFAAKPTDAQITAAIDRGVQSLLDTQTDKGWWSPNGTYRSSNRDMDGAYEVCAMLALAYAEVSMNNEKMRKGFEELLKFDMKFTYTCSLRIMTISKLLPRLRRELRDRARKVMKKDALFLIRTQHDGQQDSGTWGYPNYARGATVEMVARQDTWWDFSNTQMAILGLGEATKAGLEIPAETMKKAQDRYLQEQLADGGWNYGHIFGGRNVHRDSSYGSMSAAAVASLFITRDYLYRGIGCPCKGGQSSGRVPRIDKAIDRGLDWLGEHFSATEHPAVVPGGARRLANWLPYWLYACERAGLASGIKYFGGHDWYAEGADYFLRRQGRSGDWSRVWDTCYAICFLVKGRAPILFNKLKFEGRWNSHSRDVANLAAYIANLKEQPIQWQIINLIAPVEEWHDAPILYITAESPLKLTAEEKKKLREFTDTGGTILFEASCGNPGAKNSWEQICKEVWPEWELERLDKKHELFTADQKLTGRLPLLHGAFDGMRTFLFVSWRDISCAWNTQALTKKAPLFQLGGNLYAYTTDHRPLRARLAERKLLKRKTYLVTALQAGPRSDLTAARVKHNGDWFVGRHYRPMQRVAGALVEQGQITLKTVEPLAPSELADSGVDIAHLTGRSGAGLSDAQAAALKKYLADGGLLLAEAAMGDKRFDGPLRNLARQLGLELKPLAADAPLLTGGLDVAVGYNVTGVKYKHSLRIERIGKLLPLLDGLYLDGKLVGIYSPFDLTFSQTGFDAYGCRGYEDQDALAILTNFLLWASTR